MRLVYRDRQCSTYFFKLCVRFLAINLRDRAIIYKNMPLFPNTSAGRRRRHESGTQQIERERFCRELSPNPLPATPPGSEGTL